MAKVYTDEEIQQLSQNPLVLEVSRHQMSLTLGFRQEIYDAWILKPSPITIRDMLEDNGFDIAALGRDYWVNLQQSFRRSGRPTREYHFKPLPAKRQGMDTFEKEAFAGQGRSGFYSKEELIATGKFIPAGRGATFSPGFEAELFSGFPEKTIDQGLADAGLEADAVSCSLRKQLDIKFRKAIAIGSDYAASRRREEAIQDEDLQFLKMNPFVEEATADGIVLGDLFFHTAAPLRDQPIDDVLDVFLVRHSLLTHTEKIAASARIKSMQNKAPVEFTGKTVLALYILHRRECALAKEADREFERLRELYKTMRPMEKKKFCLWVSSLPKDPGNIYTKAEIIRRIGIPRSAFYHYVGDDGFGMGEARRAEKDAADARAIRFVWEYKGFHKGCRQVYMLLPRLAGNRKIGMNRIRRIMKEQGMTSGTRKPNPARRRASAKEDESVKPDILRRRFRLYRPNEVRVTDVTYLDYGDSGDGKPFRAYGSALMDPVTGRLLAFIISKKNDLELALETLHKADKHPCADGGIFHSDQGVLYKSREFQKEILDRGLRQSMSKKGNCWDNATIESFFGHFKDECDYASCGTLEELKETIVGYAKYYNYERCLWDRGRMPPVEYERYLLTLDEKAFAEYLEKEEEKYRAMKERAAILAKKRYGTLGIGEDGYSCSAKAHL